MTFSAFNEAQLTFHEWVTITNKRGLHARAAARFVRIADCFAATITVTRDETAVPGRSIMGLMMLAATPGVQIKITATGCDAAEALAELSALVKRKFDEDE